MPSGAARLEHPKTRCHTQPQLATAQSGQRSQQLTKQRAGRLILSKWGFWLLRSEVLHDNQGLPVLPTHSSCTTSISWIPQTHTQAAHHTNIPPGRSIPAAIDGFTRHTKAHQAAYGSTQPARQRTSTRHHSTAQRSTPIAGQEDML